MAERNAKLFGFFSATLPFLLYISHSLWHDKLGFLNISRDLLHGPSDDRQLERLFCAVLPVVALVGFMIPYEFVQRLREGTLLATTKDPKLRLFALWCLITLFVYFGHSIWHALFPNLAEDIFHADDYSMGRRMELAFGVFVATVIILIPLAIWGVVLWIRKREHPF